MISCALKYTLRYDQKHAHAPRDNDEAPDGKLRVPIPNREDAESEDYERECGVPPVGNFFVSSHQSLVNVFASRLRIPEPSPNLLPVVEEGVHEDRGARRKIEAVRQRVGHRDVHRRVRPVLRKVKHVVCHDPRDVVLCAGVVESGAREDGEVAGIPDVLVVQDRRDTEEEDCDRSPAICGDVERRRERLSGVRDLGPVERNWNEAESRVHPEYSVDFLVIRSDVAREGERRERLPDIVGEPEPHERAEGDCAEEAVPRDSPAV